MADIQLTQTGAQVQTDLDVVENLSDAFTSKTYAVGDVVIYNSKLYKCHTAVTVASSTFTGDNNWTEIKLQDLASKLYKHSVSIGSNLFPPHLLIISTSSAPITRLSLLTTSGAVSACYYEGTAQYYLQYVLSVAEDTENNLYKIVYFDNTGTITTKTFDTSTTTISDTVTQL